MKNLVVVILLLCTSIALSRACSCIPLNGSESYCRYDVIFRGQAIAEYEEREEPIDFNDPYWEYTQFSQWVYTMRVTTVVKMPEELRASRTITMKSPVEDSLCGLRLHLDIDAIFFAYISLDGEITTTHCAPNTDWGSLSEEDRQFFNQDLPAICAEVSQRTTTTTTTTTTINPKLA